MTNLVDQYHWDACYQEHEFMPASANDALRLWLQKFINATSRTDVLQTCFEIGCFPGRYLAVFGDAGYELNGIDLTPRVSTDMPRWLAACRYKTGTFRQADFCSFVDEKKYDVVCSFGFIEHFPNFEEILQLHTRLVKEGGYLVVCAPNFRGSLQYVLHKYLDSDNLGRHWVPAMNPPIWAKVAESSGFKIIESGYLGSFDFWVEEQPRNYWQRRILSLISRLKPHLERIVPYGLPMTAPYCGLIAQKIR